MNRIAHFRARGVSLIELMIALAIGSLLLLGLVQVFAASRTAYQLSEGLARVQENGRFAIDYLQRDIRMAGHMGCVNDQARFQTNPAGFGSLFVNAAQRAAGNFTAANDRVRFDVPIQAYNANGTAPGQTVNLAAPVGGWTPALPAHIAALNPLPGTDVLVLRYFSPEGIPVIAITPGASAIIQVDTNRMPVLRSGGVTTPGLMAIADCLHATVFQAKSVTVGPPAVTNIVVDGSGVNQSDFAPDTYLQGQAVLYRADTVVYYIANNTAVPARPALFRTRFNANPGAGAFAQQDEELVEGIESMQLMYGQDSQTNPTRAPSGFIDRVNVAGSLFPIGTNEQTWRRVGVIKVGLLARSPDPAAAPDALTVPRALGVNFTTPPNDTLYRSVYETSVALRNRLYGN